MQKQCEYLTSILNIISKNNLQFTPIIICDSCYKDNSGLFKCQSEVIRRRA